jgi:ABC-type multidrug transport system ATPase subunit
LHEFLSFHFKFKNLSAGYTIEKIIDISGLKEAKDKFIKNFSSGMKQRVKLATVFFSESQIILLDEPTTNLDVKGVEWYDEMLKTINNKMVLIGSNLEREYRQCNTILNISDYK